MNDVSALSARPNALLRATAPSDDEHVTTAKCIASASSILPTYLYRKTCAMHQYAQVSVPSRLITGLTFHPSSWLYLANRPSPPKPAHTNPSTPHYLLEDLLMVSASRGLGTYTPLSLGSNMRAGHQGKALERNLIPGQSRGTSGRRGTERASLAELIISPGLGMVIVRSRPK